jgi:hypothetical protein
MAGNNSSFDKNFVQSIEKSFEKMANYPIMKKCIRE